MPGAELQARAFVAAPNGFILVDRQGCIVDANPALLDMFGHTADTLIGQAIETLLPETLHATHTERRAAYMVHPEKRAMGTGRVLHARHAQGHQFPVEIGLNPVETPEGTLVLASVVDISERIALASAFQGLFEASPYGLLIVTDEGCIAMANQTVTRTLGHPLTALLGQPLSLLLPERYRGHHDGLIDTYRQTGEARMMGQGRDLTALHADGTEVPVEIGLSRVQWMRRTMTLAVISDISMRKQLELELRQANNHLQEFTYVASHDLRSPLRGIANLVEWIQADLGDAQALSAAVQHNLERIAHRVHRIERLIDDLLQYARAGSDASGYVLVDLNELMHDIIELQAPPESMQIHIDVEVPPFRAARTPLETVFRNLLSNAVKHHDQPQEGHLQIVARTAGSDCHIQVIDDGPGIPISAQSRIFKLFQTLSSKDQGHSGIGLAVTKRLVEGHGGRIELQSPLHDGRGACFSVWWPRFLRRGQYDRSATTDHLAR